MHAWGIHSNEDLEVWRLSYQLSLDIWQDAGRFPRSELYGLTSQLRRCSSSVPANIAEGTRRLTVGEFRNSLSVASGSNAETDVFLRMAGDLGLMDPAIVHERRTRNERIHRMLTGLILSLGSRPRKRKRRDGS